MTTGPKVTVSTSVCYAIQNEMECARIYIEHDDTIDNNGKWVGVTADTSFGAVAYHWSNIGNRPWRDFLTSISSDSLLTKLFGKDKMVFDPAATIDKLIQYASENVAELGEAEVEEFIGDARRYLDDGPSDEEAYFYADLDDRTGGVVGLWELRSIREEKINSQAAGFLNYCWAPFAEHLRAEAEDFPAQRPTIVRPKG